VQLAFAINLGVVTKIHRRTAIVAHITRGGTGLMMESLTAQSNFGSVAAGGSQPHQRRED
jgi:hypothetical protein